MNKKDTILRSTRASSPHYAGRTRAHAKGYAALLAALVSVASLAAQTEPETAQAKSDDIIVLDRVFVTGSNIPLAGEASVAPVVSISPTSIEDSGVTNDLLEVIRKTAPQFSGNGNLGGGNGNISSGSTNGGSALALRNAATLVLVNGRRLAAAPVAGSGGAVFIDVNSIPVSAIEKIEILTDGASAIYGSDAVAGVVNITLKSDFEGVLLGGRYAFTQNEGKYHERSAYAVAGAKNDKGTKLVASIEWTKTDPIYNGEREFSRPSYGTTNFAGVIQPLEYDPDLEAYLGGAYYYLDPSLNSPKPGATLEERGYTGPFTTTQILRKFDLSKFVTQRISNEKKIGTVNIEQKLGKLVAYGDVLLSRTDTTSQLNAQPLSVRILDSDNLLGMPVSVRNRFVDHPRTYNAKSDSFRGIVGLKGDLTDNWYFDSAINYNRATQDFANGGLVRTAGRIAAVDSGKIDLFSRTQPAGALDGVLGAAQGKYFSYLYSLDFKAVGTDLFMLPGGGISVAVGGEMRKEKLTASSDPDSQSETFAYDSGTSIDPFNATRNVGSLFAETKIPLVGKNNRIPGIYSATLTIAGRHEIYDDGDDPTVPKFALSYQPLDDTLLLRATASSSYAAPSIYNLHSPPSIGFTSDLAEFDGNQANSKSYAVSHLAPSKSHALTFGFVWTPTFVRGLEVSVDYFKIKQTALISSYGASGVVDAIFHDVEVNGGDSKYAQYVHMGDFDGPTINAPGQISSLGLDNIYYVIPSSANLGSQKLGGFDVKLAYSKSLGEFGKIRFESASTYYDYYDIQIFPDAEYQHTVGMETNLNGTIPRWRTYSTVAYSIHGFTLALANTLYPPTVDSTWTQDYADLGYKKHIPAYYTFDAHLSYEFKQNRSWFKSATLTVGVDNIANRMPPKAATFDSLSNADIDEFSPIGRLFYVSGEYKF